MGKTKVLWISDGVYYEDLRLIIPLNVDGDFNTYAANSIQRAMRDLELRERPDVIVIGRVVFSTERRLEKKRKRDRTVWEKANLNCRPLRIELIKYLIGAPDALEQIGETKKFDPMQILVYGYGSLRDNEKEVLRNMGIENIVIIENDNPLVVLNVLREMIASSQK
jgi:hypothetical protein